MDRNSLIGIILIATVVGVWVFLQSSTSTRDITPEKTKQKVEQRDSIKSAVKPEVSSVVFTKPSESERTLTVQTDLITVRLSSYGATFTSYKLKNYQPWYKETAPNALVDLIQPGAREFGFSFRTMNGSKVEAVSIPFEWSTNKDVVTVTGSDSVIIKGTARTLDGGIIERSYRFTGNKYDVATTLTLDSMESIIPQTNRYVNLEWKKGIRYQEHSTVDESNQAACLASYNGELDELDASEFNVPVEQSANGKIEFIATKTKYFLVALKPMEEFDGSAFYGGIRYGAPDEGHVEQYHLTYKLPYSGGRQTHRVLLYAGPMQYDTLSHYGLTNVMNFGWKWIIKPIGEYFMLPTLKFIHSGIANYGVAIILFALLMKLLLYPLSITQLKSAQKMKLVGPLVNEAREKYKDDMQKQQQETMKIYGEYGINPAGGCFPLLLQMPFLYALYAVLNLNIELRQAAFLPVWITDMSIPDVVLSLPFKLPLFNIDKFSGLALLMGATLFIQQKQAVTDPRQKAMVYMMPVMLTLMFSTLPSGLNLYYFVFNVVGIAQQLYINKYSRKQLTLADLRKMPKKESWLQRKMREAQEMAGSQGKSIPGQSKQLKNGKNDQNLNKKRR
ncbi:MAG: membrane protein insertase YidC [Ignavibacteria bacterium]|nr:membrane protein insertase YidC [Ignavibacteria bacterium]